MSINPKITELINRLNQELEQLEQLITEGLDLVRLPLSRFPENSILVQFFAYLSNVLFFISNYRQEVSKILELLSVAEVTIDEVEETGQRLSTMLGVVLETKMRVEGIVNRLRE